MLQKTIKAYGATLTLACDGRCDKAWGMNGRPKTKLSSDDDDYVYVSDDELATAPGPGETRCVSEGADLKPSATPLAAADAARMNKWCFRECERSTFVDAGQPVVVRDLRKPRPNLQHRTYVDGVRVWYYPWLPAKALKYGDIPNDTPRYAAVIAGEPYALSGQWVVRLRELGDDYRAFTKGTRTTVPCVKLTHIRMQEVP